MPKYNLDPRQILKKRRREVLLPLPVAKPIPRQNPNAVFPEGTYFFNASEYLIDSHDRVFFRDPLTRDTVYLSRIDTTNHIHNLQAYFITNELHRHTTQMRAPGTNRDTVIDGKRVDIEFLGNPDVVAWTRKDGSIAVNRSRRGGLQDNVYSIYSTFRHENIHIMRKHYGKRSINNIEHAGVYYEQMTYEEFGNTPYEYQLQRILIYVTNVISRYDSDNNFNISGINKSFEEFQDEIGNRIGAVIQFDDRRKKIIISLMGSSREFDYVKRNPMAPTND